MPELLQYIRTAPALSLILAVTIITSIAALRDKAILRSLMLHPYSIARGKQLHTLFTSGFAHGDVFHLIFNMIALFSFGNLIERLLVEKYPGPLAGHLVFVIIYVVALLFSDWRTVMRESNNPRYFSLGASGAVSAIIFMTIPLVPSATISIIFLPIPMTAWLFGLLYLAFEIWQSKSGRYTGINHDAHIWGALFGIAVAFVLFSSQISLSIRQMFS